MRAHSIRSLCVSMVILGAGVLCCPHARAQDCGDVNDDGAVLATDALAVLQKAVGQDVELVCTSEECLALEERVAALEDTLTGVSKQGDTLLISGANVQIVDGTGDTDGDPNGLGNLIVGYNEDPVPAAARSGSHNVVIGRNHSYASYGGLVAGLSNQVLGPGATVAGGSANVASGNFSFVGGGLDNLASGQLSSVSAGASNDATGDYSSVAGGAENTASGITSSVIGGDGNIASGLIATASGGQDNTAMGHAASVSGGFNRDADGEYDWRAGALLQDQ